MKKKTKSKIKDKNKMTANSVIFSYSKDSSYILTHPTGAEMNTDAQGNVVMHFYNDILAIPENVVNKLNKGVIKDPKKRKEIMKDGKLRDKKNVLVDRILRVSIMLSTNNAIDTALAMLKIIFDSPSTELNKKDLKLRLKGEMDSL